jgi:1,4-alpha-glucan branching enzyme
MQGGRWFKNTIIYCVDVDTFKDGNGDGIGDFIGLRQGLSYLAGLGIGCLWLLPFHSSPGRDNGYDITDYLSVHPALGDLGDFAAFMDEAQDRGIRVIIDLVVNHTSDQHPWFLDITGITSGEKIDLETRVMRWPFLANKKRCGTMTKSRKPTIFIGFTITSQT